MYQAAFNNEFGRRANRYNIVSSTVTPKIARNILLETRDSAYDEIKGKIGASNAENLGIKDPKKVDGNVHQYEEYWVFAQMLQNASDAGLMQKFGMAVDKLLY